MPLVITRKEGQSFELRHNGVIATIKIKSASPTTVALEIEAPREMVIVRDNAKHKRLGSEHQ